MMSEQKHLAIVGATGAVGVEMLECLERSKLEVGEITLLASKRSAGKVLNFRGEEVVVKELTRDSFSGVKIALFAAGGGTSLEFAPFAVKAGAIVIDNSSAYRMDPEVPLIVPEVNPEDVKSAAKGIIANPNCTTIISLMALYPLHKKYGLKSIIASSYQAVSGSGAQGIAELKTQVEALVKGEEVISEVYPRQIAFNVIPQVDAFEEGGYTKEELKMLNEMRKILKEPKLKVSCTCVRVPVYRSHSVSIVASFERPVDVTDAQSEYANYPGVELRDDPAQGEFPVPLDTTHKDDCLVGRIRRDLVQENALSLWVVGDQVRKGAALNAVQIAEIL